jgi:hypothetical protein
MERIRNPEWYNKPDPHQTKRWIWIRIRVKDKNPEVLRLKMEPWSAQGGVEAQNGAAEDL